MKVFLVFFFFLSMTIQNLFSFDIKCFPSDANLIIDHRIIEPQSMSGQIRHYCLPDGWKYAFLRAPHFRDKYIPFHKQWGRIEEYKLERFHTHLVFDAFVKTGSQPKSVRFSPDGKFYVTALLNGGGIEVFHTGSNTRLPGIAVPEKYAVRKGFVETLFLRSVHELWVSQMTTGMIHVFDSRNFSYKGSFPTEGRWSKVIAVGRKGKLAFVSNWESQTISVVNVEAHRVIRLVHTPGIPRGLGVSPDNNYLYAALYSSGMVVKIDLSSMKIVKKINLGHGAPRHIVVSRKTGRVYVSDMFKGRIFVLDSSIDRVLFSFYVGSNLNTIALGPAGRYLFISSRGKNSRKGYLHKGPVFGKIFVYDVKKHKIIDWTWGGNQPTGLAVSPNGKVVAFTDFLDHRIEIYWWEKKPVYAILYKNR